MTANYKKPPTELESISRAEKNKRKERLRTYKHGLLYGIC